LDTASTEIAILSLKLLIHGTETGEKQLFYLKIILNLEAVESL
jgi:hypothetical protein